MRGKWFPETPTDPGGNHHAEFGSSMCAIKGRCEVEGVDVLQLATPTDDGESDKKKCAPKSSAPAAEQTTLKSAKQFAAGFGSETGWTTVLDQSRETVLSDPYNLGATVGSFYAAVATTIQATGWGGNSPAEAVVGPSAVGGNAARSLEAVSDAAFAAGKRVGAAAELRIGERVFTGVSGEVVAHNSEVTGALMGTPSGARTPWHGGCAEIVCLDKARNAGVNPAGGTVRTF